MTVQILIDQRGKSIEMKFFHGVMDTVVYLISERIVRFRRSPKRTNAMSADWVFFPRSGSVLPENLGRKVATFLKKTTDTTDIKVNIAILKFDQSQ
jgi:hypothetical protein